PVRLDEATRAMFAAMGKLPGKYAADLTAVAARKGGAPDAGVVARLSKSPYYNALLRTTCVPTMVTAGHAENALPQRASATVNCRSLPGEDPAEVEKTLVRVVADPAIHVSRVGAIDAAGASAMLPELMDAVESVTRAMWPKVVVLPSMSTGATDGRFL